MQAIADQRAASCKLVHNSMRDRPPFSTASNYAPPTPIKPTTTDVPGNLAKQEAALFDNVARACNLDDEVSLQISAEAMSSLQRARKAREAIDKDGMTSSTVRRSSGRILY